MPCFGCGDRVNGCNLSVRRVNGINVTVNGKMIRYGWKKPPVPDHFMILHKSFHEIKGVKQRNQNLLWEVLILRGHLYYNSYTCF